MLSTWLSARSLVLHLTVIVWVSGCAFAAWWQVGRAMQGNAFSYGYAVEWPVFAIAGLWCWWVMLHGHGATGEDREIRHAHATQTQAAAQQAKRDRAGEDPYLAAYNDYLAKLSAAPRRRAWRH